jgi:uncharacterized protein (TIGR02246 family)
MTTTDRTTDRTADDVAIRNLIHEIERSFNENDADLAVAQFTDDAVAVGVNGALNDGRDALLAAHRTGFAGALRDQRARYELGELRFLGPDVAVAHKRAWATDGDGNDLDADHAMVALYVFVRQGDGWRVAARQNTLVSG